MNLRRAISTLSMAFAAAAASPWAIGQGRPLQHDPFARPVFNALPVSGTERASARQAQAVRDANPKLKLQAVLVAGPDSMANVDGVLVRVGESVQGYRLVSVHDRSAVFEKNNAMLTLEIGAKK